MRIIAFIQDEHSIKDIMKAQGLGRELGRTGSPTFRLLHLSLSSSIALRLSMKFLPTTRLSRLLMNSKLRFLGDGKEGVRISRHFWQLSPPGQALFGALKPWRGETDHAFLPSLDSSRQNNDPPATTLQLLTKKRSIVLAFLDKQPITLPDHYRGKTTLVIAMTLSSSTWLIAPSWLLSMRKKLDFIRSPIRPTSSSF